MTSGLSDSTIDLTCKDADVVVIDDDEPDQPPSRADIYGEGTEPPAEADPSPSNGPLWEWRDDVWNVWQWLHASVQPNYTKLGWQAERVWTQLQDHYVRCQFRAALGIVEWDPMKMPIYAIIMKIALPDADGKTKVLMLLAEQGGNPPSWENFIIKRLRRCEYKECYRFRMVNTEFPLFTDVQKLQIVVRALIQWVLTKSPRLSDILSGTWRDLRLI